MALLDLPYVCFKLNVSPSYQTATRNQPAAFSGKSHGFISQMEEKKVVLTETAEPTCPTDDCHLEACNPESSTGQVLHRTGTPQACPPTSNVSGATGPQAGGNYCWERVRRNLGHFWTLQ